MTKKFAKSVLFTAILGSFALPIYASSVTVENGASNFGPVTGGTNITYTDSKTIKFGDGELRDTGLYLTEAQTNVKFDGQSTNISLSSENAGHSFVAAQVKGGTTAEFAADDTIIESNGIGGLGRWGFGLLVNGPTDNGAAKAIFTGKNVTISNQTDTYTSQTLTIKNGHTAEFHNDGNVTVNSKSAFAVTGVDARGTLLIDNTGSFNVNGSLIPDTKTGAANVVGFQGAGTGTKLTVTDRVSALNIRLSGLGVDDDGTDYSTGTKAFDFAEGATVDINAEQFNIEMTVPKDVIDASPKGHTSTTAHGLSFNSEAKLTTGANTHSNILIANGSGSAVGILNDGADMHFKGAVDVNVNALKDATALNLKNGHLIFDGNVNVQATAKDNANAYAAVIEGGTLQINGLQNHFEGTVAVNDKATVTFANGNTLIDGALQLGSPQKVFALPVADSNGLTLKGATVTVNKGVQTVGNIETTLENSELILGADSTLGKVTANQSGLTVQSGKTEINSLEGSKNTLTFADTDAAVHITDNQSDKLALAAKGNVTDDLNGDISALISKVTVGTVSPETGKPATPTLDSVKMDAGDVVGEVSKIGNGPVIEKKNEANDAKLNRMANMPTMMTRIQMNELRKRMGDIRASEGQTGVWARYNGGNLQGAYNLDADFNMIQFGADTSLGNGLPRVGAAFSYARTEADDLYGSVDMDAYSLSTYGIWTWDNGAFLDVIARAANVDTDMKELGQTGSLDNWLFSFSTELGQRAVFAETFYAEPSAEFTYTWMDGDSFTMGDVKREIGDSESLIGRFGITLGKQCPSGFGDLYIRAGLVHEFMGNASITSTKGATSRTIIHDGNDTWVEYAVGGNVNFSKNAYMYVDLERTEGAELEEDWRANVGVRYTF